MEAAGIGSLPTTTCSWVVANIPRMAASGTLPVRSCRGYISAPWVSGGQATKASTKAWQSCPSSAFTLHSSISIFSLWVCCRTQALVAWQTSASLMAAVWHTSASFIASIAWVLFRCNVNSVLSPSYLWWESIVTLVVSNCSRAAFILSCSWRSSLVSPPGPRAVRWKRCSPPLVLVVQSAGAVDKWYEWS